MPFFFQLLHQRGVVVARRRLGKMLLGAQGFKTQRFDPRRPEAAKPCSHLPSASSSSSADT